MAAFMKNMQPFSVVELFADPPVKITGRPDAVSMAADRIRAELDPLDNPNRVSLKMEVSWTDHSHIIGREGRSIKSVSTLTNCHIHFPDSNRFSETEKCNQVSIAGDPQAVETARAQVRILSPVIFAFEIPFATEIQSILESRQSPQMQYIQNAYNVQIIVRNKGRPGTVALVKGNSWELDKVKVATRALMQHLCQGETEAMMYLEISPHYHSSVLGSNGASAVRAIMAVTSTTIVWPNLADTSLHPLRKATFVISGQLDKVYAAREMLIGSLPLVLMADLPQGLDLEMEKVQHVMTMMKVTVSTRPKNKNGVLYRTLVIRGSERHVDHLYEARRILLGLPHDARIHCRVPESYHVPPAPPSVPLQPPLPIHTLPLLPIPSSSGGYNRYSPDEPPTSLLGWYPTATGSPATPSPGHQSHGAYSQGSYPYHHYPYFTPTDNSKMFCSVNSWLYPDRRSSMVHTPVNTRSYASHGSNFGSDWNTSGNESKFSSSFMTSTGGTEAGSSSNSLSSSSYSLFSASNNSGSSTSPTHAGLHGLRGTNPGKMGVVDCHDMATGLDYNTRRALASRAMSQEVNPDVPRTPTTAWSGMGFSKSHTAALLAMNRSGFALGSSPTSTTLEEREPPKTPGYSAVKTNSSSDEDKPGDGNQKEALVGNSGCRVANASGSLSSMGSMASSQQTSMSPSYVNRASTAEWRSSWSDFENEDCSINESLFLSGKASVGSFGSPEKHAHDSTSSISGLAACLAGLNTSGATLTGSDNQKGSISSMASIDTNNNTDGSKHSPGGGGGRVSLSSTGSPPILSTMNNPPGTPRPQSTSQMNFSSSNVIDGVVPLPRPIIRGNDLCDLLAKLNLSKYYEFFREQDIDITTFLTLTESDLVRLGISTFGARRKILVAIRDLREHGGPVFSGSAAVGAERRPSNY